MKTENEGKGDTRERIGFPFWAYRDMPTLVEVLC